MGVKYPGKKRYVTIWNILFMARKTKNDRSVVTDRNVASFQANRSKVSFNLLSLRNTLMAPCVIFVPDASLSINRR